MPDLSRKTLETFIVRSASQAVGLVLGIVMARTLGPSGKGAFAYATTVLAVLVTLSGGASAAISRQYGRLKLPSGAVYAGMMRFILMCCLPVSAALAAFAIITHQPALLAPALVFPFAYINQVSIAFSLVDGNVRWSNIQGLSISALVTAVVCVLCLTTRQTIPVLVGWIVAQAAFSAVSLWKIKPYAKNFGTAPERAVIFREQLTFGFRVTFNQLLALLNYQVDIFIVLYLLGPVALGIYSVAVGLGQLVWHLSRPLTLTSYGVVTSGTPKEAARMTMLCVRHSLFTVGIASLVLFAAGPWLITVAYGQAFAHSGLALRVLLPGIVAYCMVPFFSQYFTLQLGKPGITTIITAVSTLVCAVSTILLVPRFGIIAGAIGTSGSYIAAFAICAVVFSRHAGVPLRRLIVFGKDDWQRYVALARWVVSLSGAR